MAAADTMMVGGGGRGHGCGLLHHDRLRPHQHRFKPHRPHPLLVPPPHGSLCPPSCGPPTPFGRHHHPGHSHGPHLIPHHPCPHVMGGEPIGLDDQDPFVFPPHHHHHHPGPPAFAGFLGPHLHHPGHHSHRRRHGRVNPDAPDVGGLDTTVADCSLSGSEEEDCLHPESRNTDGCPLEGPAITENFVENFWPPPPPHVRMHMMMMHWGHAGRFMHAGELPLHHRGSETPHDLLPDFIHDANSFSDHELEKTLRIRLLRHGGRRMRHHGGRRCTSVPHGAHHGCHPHRDAAVLMRGHSGERGNIATTSAPINDVETPNPGTADKGVEDTNDALALMALDDTTKTDVNPSH